MKEKGKRSLNRIDLFKQHGYDCLVFWASELKDKDKILHVVGRL